MRATVFHGLRDLRVEQVPDAGLRLPTDAVVRVTGAAICGSDLWFYRGVTKWEPGWRTGHEFIGVVEEVGSEVRRVRPGDTVIAPFAYSDGTCEFCEQGLNTSCLHGGYWGGDSDDGGQGEAVRVPLADGTLVRVEPDFASVPDHVGRLVALADVLPTGHHAAVSAGVGPGSTVLVVGDGAVGLCAVLASARLGAERIIAAGHHPERLALATRLGATEVLDSGPEGAAERVLEMTGGGAHCVLEAVGMQESMKFAVASARPGGVVGYVGVPHGVESLDLRRMFSHNIALRGGVAPVRAYLPELLADVEAGRLDASPIFDLAVDLDGIPGGYAAMDERRALKVLIQPA